MLLARALKRAQREHDVLHAVRAEREGAPYLTGLGAAAADISPADFAAAMEAVVAEFIGLMARFLGAELTIRLLRQCFPEIRRQATGSGSEETHR